MEWLKLSNKANAHITAEGALRDTLLLLFFIFISALPSFAHHRDTLGTGNLTYFVENRGQWNHPFRFQAQMHNAAFFAEPNCFTIALRQTPDQHTEGHFHHAISQQMHAYKVHFAGSNPDVQVSGINIDPFSGYDNYYYGHDPSRWVSGIPHCKTLYYANLYPGIDMDVQVAQHALKNDFYLSPGANVSDIVLQYDGVEKLYLSGSNLIIRTSVGELIELAPYAYQETDTGVAEIPARYQLRGNTVRFILESYNPSLPLTIDPVLHFSTYTGSQADNWGTTATYDNYKNTYTAGIVFGIGYPVSVGAYDGTHNGIADIGIFKFNSDGTQRLFATYLGGSNADMPHSMYVNTFDELVIFGTTGSPDFPVSPNAYDTSFNGGTSLQFENTYSVNFPNGSDIFISRFNNTGTELQASTFVGGTYNDGINYRARYNNGNIIMNGNDSLYYNYGDGARGELITDDLNNIYVGSTTFSTDFPTTPNSIMPTWPHAQCGVVFKIDYNLRNLIWSTYLGGGGDDAVYSIDVDTSYNVIVCGGTNSTNFPTTPDAFQPAYGGGTADGFISKISYNGDQLMASTYYGSPQYDQIFFVRIGRHNETFIFGQTKAQGNTMIYNANYNVPGSGMLLARLHPNLNDRDWSTVFGTPIDHPNLSPTAFAADICNRIYAAGWGRDFVGYGPRWNEAGTTGMEVTPDAYQSTTDGQDFYIMSMSTDASQLDYATFFGELHGGDVRGGQDHVDGGTSRFDKMATLYQSVCASCSGNDAFPTTPGVWSSHNLSDNCNNAVFKINIHDDFAVADFVPPPVGCAPYTVQFTNTGRGTSFLWDFGDGSTSTEREPQHTFNQHGVYTVRLIASINNGCKPHDTVEYTVRVLQDGGRFVSSTTACNGAPVQIGMQPMLGCTYEWIQGNVSDNSVANPFVYEDGIYILRITSNQGCYETDTFSVISVYLVDTVIVNNPTCPGSNNGSITAVLYPNVRDSAHYYWDGVEGDSVLSNLSADGTPHTLVVESRGCRHEQTFTLTDPPRLNIQNEHSPVLCHPDCDGWIHLTYGLPDAPPTDTLIQNLCPGTYIINLHDPVGCPYSDTSVIIQDSSLWHLSAWADDSILFLTESVRLHATEVPGASYSWTHGNTLDRPTSPNPLATPTDTVTIYGVTVSDSLGCSWYGEIPIHCIEVTCGRHDLFIPNAFSPNGDGVNDRLCFTGKFITDFYIAIYTRWGEKVYESTDLNQYWDGRYNGNWCMPGVYTYTCRIKCETGLQNLLKGDITIIR